MVNFGTLAAEICYRVWGTPANFNGFRVLAALLHGIPVLSVVRPVFCSRLQLIAASESMCGFM